MSLFKGLGESREAPEALTQEQQDLIDGILADSWGRVPESWLATITASQVEDFLEGVASEVIRRDPTVPTRELIIYLLGKAVGVDDEGGGGSGEGVVISPDAGNRLERRINGLYSKPAAWNSKEW